MNNLSRREFAAVVAGAAIAGRATPSFAQVLTAQNVIDRIKKNIGVDWRTESVDGLKAGDASASVKGVATTAMATLAVLQQAVKAGANFVITSEPTFYSRADVPKPGAAAYPVFAAKSEFITRNNLVVFRLSDHWRLRKPDPLTQGIAAALGWTKYQSADDPLRFEMPALTIDTLASRVKEGLRSRGGIRVIGDPQARVQHVGLLPATTPIQASLQMLPNVDVIVAGEIREWETAEYARDVVFSGQKKGLIVVGRVVSEEPGMDVCAGWLKTFITEVPVRHISAGDPYWRPTA